MKSACLIAMLFVIAAAHADLNAKAFDSVDVRITQSGTLRISGNVQKANLSYYIPQEGLASINPTSSVEMTWKYATDSFGNRVIVMEWLAPSGVVDYSIDMLVHNEAKHSPADKAIGSNDLYLQQTKSVRITDEIRVIGFPYEKSLRKAAELAKFVNDYLDYDIDYVGKNLPSDEVLRVRRGVCVEFSNMLAALLRANEIPTRYVVGYAYSPKQKNFLGHVWLEVLLIDGTWVPLDPTWLQAGYIDATHIKSGTLLDNNQLDTLTYIGGSINWTRNDEAFELLDYRERNITSISLETPETVPGSSYGYMKAALDVRECTIVTMGVASCVNGDREEMLTIYEKNRSFWACAPKDVYWFFRTSGNGYKCPVAAYDQTGSSSQGEITIDGFARQKRLTIDGPDAVRTGEEFTLTADSGLFYSPEFGLNDKNTWTLSIAKPGTHSFYLYDENSLFIKMIGAAQLLEFDARVLTTNYAELGNRFNVNLTVKNLLDAKTISINIDYTNQSVERDIFLNNGEEKNLSFVMEANTPGFNELIIGISGETLASKTVMIETPEKKGLIEEIAGMFQQLIDWLSTLF